MKQLCLLLFFLLSFPVMAQDDDAFLLYTSYEDPALKVFVLNAHTGEEKLIVELEIDGYTQFDTGWAGDTSTIWVVDSVKSNQRRLRFFDVLTGEESTFSQSLLNDPCYPALDWSPDGEILAYFSGKPDDAQLNFLHLSDRTGFSIEADNYDYIQWSRDGRYILINDFNGDKPTKFLATADGTELLPDINLASRNNAFSPDMKYFAYLDDTIWLYELATDTRINLEILGGGVNWSPDARYLVTSYAENIYYYDVQTGELNQFDLGYPIRFVSWTQDANSVLFYSNWQILFDILYPQSLVQYDMASGQIKTIMETTGWIGGIVPHGDWMVIRYSPSLPEDRYAFPSHIQISKGETSIDEALGTSFFYSGLHAPVIAWSSDGRWLLIRANDNYLYHFDIETATVEPVVDEQAWNPFWSPDGDYLTFVTDSDLKLWHTESDTIETLRSVPFRLIGWKGSSIQDSLLYCGEG